MKLEGQVRIRKKRASGVRRAFTLLAAVAVAISGRIFVQEDYFVRELLIFVGCAALLVFFAANLALLGILFHAAGRTIVQHFPKPRIAALEEGGSQQQTGPVVGAPTIATAPRIGPL